MNHRQIFLYGEHDIDIFCAEMKSAAKYSKIDCAKKAAGLHMVATGNVEFVRDDVSRRKVSFIQQWARDNLQKPPKWFGCKIPVMLKSIRRDLEIFVDSPANYYVQMEALKCVTEALIFRSKCWIDKPKKVDEQVQRIDKAAYNIYLAPERTSTMGQPVYNRYLCQLVDHLVDKFEIDLDSVSTEPRFGGQSSGEIIDSSECEEIGRDLYVKAKKLKSLGPKTPTSNFILTQTTVNIVEWFYRLGQRPIPGFNYSNGSDAGAYKPIGDIPNDILGLDEIWGKLYGEAATGDAGQRLAKTVKMLEVLSERNFEYTPRDITSPDTHFAPLQSSSGLIRGLSNASSD